MKKTSKFIFFLVIIFIFNIAFMNYVFAEEINQEDELQTNPILNEENTVYWEDVFNTGHDNGFSDKKEIKKDDPHYGWKLGKFALSGFSSKRK